MMETAEVIMPKRMQKQFAKEQNLILKSQKLKLYAFWLYNEQKLTQIQIARRLKMPFSKV